MRTTIDLPDDLLRQAKIEAVERGAPLRQLVIDALQRELATTGPVRKRLVRQPVRLAVDAPLRHLSPAQVKALDEEDQQQSDMRRAHARDR